MDIYNLGCSGSPPTTSKWSCPESLLIHLFPMTGAVVRVRPALGHCFAPLSGIEIPQFLTNYGTGAAIALCTAPWVLTYSFKGPSPGHVVDALWLSPAMSEDFNLPSQGMLVLHLASWAQTTSVLCYPKPMLLMHCPPVESQSLQWVPENQTPVPWKIHTYPFLRHQCQQGQTLD